MRAASIVPSVNGINVCSITRTGFGKFVTITAALHLARLRNSLGQSRYAECDAIRHRQKIALSAVRTVNLCTK